MDSKPGYAVISIEYLRELLSAQTVVDFIFDEIKENRCFLQGYYIKNEQLKILFPRRCAEMEAELDE